MGRKKKNFMTRDHWLLVGVGCLVVTALAYWKNLPDAATPASPAVLQLQPVTIPGPGNDLVATPSKVDAAAVPFKDTVSAPTTNAPTTNVPTSKAPARVVRHDPPAVVSAERHEDAKPVSAPDVKAAPARASTYDRRVADANALAGQDADRALVDLQRLAADEPRRPEAYEAMAGISLRKRDYDKAREQIESALAHGGKATFTVIHDHSRGNFDAGDPKATTLGGLTILADEVRFAARGEGDSFSANWADVREAGSNRFFGSGRGGFHLTVSDDGKYKNFNLAPESKDKDEGKLILDLLKSYSKRSDRTK
jgi:hypothetical protein